jgi:hypothetical protein
MWERKSGTQQVRKCLILDKLNSYNYKQFFQFNAKVLYLCATIQCNLIHVQTGDNSRQYTE